MGKLSFFFDHGSADDFLGELSVEGLSRSDKVEKDRRLLAGTKLA
jgi:hypothetical protein